ncbi:MAG: DUF1232 domain-containing protein [Cyclobacteriaceae bacterium]|nr:DUF1232 domain-containing protein [Cyclobacteriaceae bacterium]
MISLKNSFFNRALKLATTLSGKPARILKLLVQLGPKIRQVNWSGVKGSEISNTFFLIGRLLKAQATGKYKLPVRVTIILLAAVIYFINPIDLIPDFIPGLGLTDDLAVLTWVYRIAADELERFEEWEMEKVIVA